MKATGEIKITEDLTLLNPSLDILKVNYNWNNNTVDIECLFKEGIYKHSRIFTFDTDGSGELTSLDILEFINNHETLKIFK